MPGDDVLSLELRRVVRFAAAHAAAAGAGQRHNSLAHQVDTDRWWPAL